MSEQRILLPLLGGIDGPLVDDDVVVKGGDGQRVGTPAEVDGRQAPGIFPLVQLRLCPAHELRTAQAAEAVEVAHAIQQDTARLLAKLAAEPPPVVVAQRRWRHAVDVTRHVHKQLQLVASHLGVVDIGNPYLAHLMVVGLPHLVADQSRLGGGEPQVVVGPPPVTEVVVDTTATRPALLLGIGQTGDVAVVVVTPHERGRLRHPQAVLIDFEHLLIRQEDLRHLAHILRDIAINGTGF